MAQCYTLSNSNKKCGSHIIFAYSIIGLTVSAGNGREANSLLHVFTLLSTLINALKNPNLNTITNTISNYSSALTCLSVLDILRGRRK